MKSRLQPCKGSEKVCGRQIDGDLEGVNWVLGMLHLGMLQLRRLHNKEDKGMDQEITHCDCKDCSRLLTGCKCMMSPVMARTPSPLQLKSQPHGA